MRRLLLTLVLCATAAVPATAQKGGHGGHRSGAATAHTPQVSTPRATHSASPKAPHSITPRAPEASQAPAPGARDSRGRLERRAKAKDDFMRSTGHPHGWKGHVVDHIVPLACGGADSPSNMQWQTSAEGKAKDNVERKGCKR